MKRAGTSLLVVNDTGQILLLLRDDNPEIPYSNMWDIPGGHVETSETPEQCIVREMKEEMGLDIPTPDLFLVTEFSDRTEYTFWRKMSLKIEEIHLTEGQRLQWFSKSDVANAELACQFNQVVDAFFGRRPWETARLKIPSDWPDDFPDPRRAYCKTHPILGRLVAPFLRSRFAILDEQVEAELRCRDLTLEEAWAASPEHLEVVTRLHAFFEEHLWFFSPGFLPEDSLMLLGRWITGDLCELSMLMAIEEEYNVKIPEDFIFGDPTMLDLVHFIVENRDSAG